MYIRILYIYIGTLEPYYYYIQYGHISNEFGNQNDRKK